MRTGTFHFFARSPLTHCCDTGGPGGGRRDLRPWDRWSSVRPLGLPTLAVEVASERSLHHQNRTHVRTRHGTLPFSGSVCFLDDMTAVGFCVVASWCLHLHVFDSTPQEEDVQKSKARTLPAFSAPPLGRSKQLQGGTGPP